MTMDDLGRGRGSSVKYHFSVEVASVTLRDGGSVPGGGSGAGALWGARGARRTLGAPTSTTSRVSRSG